MQIKIRSINFELTPAIEEYITKKLSHLEKFLSDGNALCEVEIGRTTKHHKSGEIFKAEVNIVGSGKQYYAVREEFDLYASIDMVRDDIERSIISGKQKKNTLFRRGATQMKELLKRINIKYSK